MEKKTNNTHNLQLLVLNGVMIALVFLTTFIIRFPGPIPPGYINLGDTVIIITALLLGKNSGFIAGAFGSALADVAVPGGYIFAPVTFIVKGIEGYIIGRMAFPDNKSLSKVEMRKIIAVITGQLVMVAGYFIAEMSVMKLFDPVFGLSAAIAELPLNLVQGAASAVLGYMLYILLERAGVRKLLE